MSNSKKPLAAKRQKYRAEFIKRNAEFQKLKQEILSAINFIKFSGSFKPFSGQTFSILHKDFTLKEFNAWARLSGLGEKLLRFTKGYAQASGQIENEEDQDDVEETFENPGLAMIIEFAWWKNKIPLEEIVAREGLLSQSGMELILTEGNEIIGSHPVDHFERNVFKIAGKSLKRCRQERKTNVRWLLKTGSTLALDGVNKSNNTILVRIRLDQKRQAIEEDFKFLLDLLKQEAKELNIDFSIPAPKKPQWDVYDRFIQAWELKESQGKTFPEIAEVIFPQHVDPEDAIRLVNFYHKKAVDFIKGEWRRI